MKKIINIFLSILLIFLIAVPAFAAENSSAVDSSYIESVDVYLPDVSIDVYGFDSSDSISAKATLDGESLSYVGSEKYDPDSVNTCIYVLADISGSVSASMYSAVKDCIKDFIKSKGNAQTVKFYSFSQEVYNILDGTENYDDACEKLNKSVVTGNGYTALYDALYLIHETAAAERDSYDKQLAVVFTDGVDEDNYAKRTLDETKNMLKAMDLPVYSMCMDHASAESKQILGELSRLSGGVNRVYSVSNIETKFDEILSTSFSCVTLNFRKSNNKAGDKDKNLSVSVNGTELPVVVVYESAVRIKTDDAAPTYSVEYNNESKCLTVTFSENVLNADKVSSYVITDSKGKSVAVDSVKYDAKSKTANLYFSGRFYSGKYTVALSGVTDDSFSANAPAGDLTVEISAYSSVWKLLDNWWIVLIPLFIVIIILLVLLVVKRKRKITNVKELFEVENESNYEVKHHIVNTAKGREIMLEIKTGSVNNSIKTRITSSLIFGRSDTCDICIDDVKLSRQHFAFESSENGEIRVMDLNSTNGTYLNGMKVVSGSPLKAGDVVSAGLTVIKVHF